MLRTVTERQMLHGFTYMRYLIIPKIKEYNQRVWFPENEGKEKF